MTLQPEAGDKSIRVVRADVAASFRSVGVVPGDVVMFHSSLSSMGTVVGGPGTVIDGALDGVGPEGTVAVPSLVRSESDKGDRVFETWDPQRTPCYVGAIPEALRVRPDAVRSDHATHSVAAIGARARELTADHGVFGERPGPFGPKAFAVASPWERFAQWNAAYCFIGVSFRVNTMVHYVESLLVQRALARVPWDRHDEVAGQVKGWLKPGVWPTIAVADREKIEDRLAEEGLVSYGKIGSATLRCARAKPMVDRWLAIVEAAPDQWLPKDFLKWLDRLVG